MDDWTCYRCSYISGHGHSRCEMCEAPRLNFMATRGSGPGPSSSWTCQRCATVNERGIQCKSCGTLMSNWNCTRCTLENRPNRHRCKACGSPKSSDQQEPVVLRARNSPMNHSNPRYLATADSRPLTGSLVLPRRQDSDFILALRAIQESEAAEQWTRIAEFCKQNKESFVDDSFPPTVKSLRQNNENYKPLPFIHWKRPQDIYDSDYIRVPWTVYRNPDPSDIMQGYLGNCWFLSALALLTEDLVENIIITKEICPQGVYQVRLCVDGQWTVVIVDDFLPCDGHNRLMYSKAKRKQLWVPLIEKALAKVHGSYAALSAGTTVEGLAVLTGAPCESIKTPGLKGKNDEDGEEIDEEILWATLLSCKDAKFLIGASCGKGDVDYENEEYRSLGLQSRHAYSLLDCRDVEGNRLVKLRNPWGHFEWKGKWSKKSSEWTPVLRQQCNSGRESEGVFWMPFESFCQYFDAVDVCKLKKNIKELRMVDILPPHCLEKLFFATHLTVTETTEVDIVLYQAKTRGESSTKHGPLDILLIVLQKGINGTVGKLVCRTTRQISPFVSCTSVMKAGEYFIVALAFNHWGMTLSLDDIPKCVVAMHSSKSLHATVSIVPSCTMADSLISMLLKEGRKKNDKSTISTYTMPFRWCGEIVMVENASHNLYVVVKCDCTTSQNVVCTRGSMQTVDVIPPRNRQIILVLSQMESSNGYTIKYSLWYLESRHSTMGSWAPRGFGYHELHAPGIGDDIKGLHLPRPISD